MSIFLWTPGGHPIGYQFVDIGEYACARAVERVAWGLREEFDAGTDEHTLALAAAVGIAAQLRYMDERAIDYDIDLEGTEILDEE